MKFTIKGQIRGGKNNMMVLSDGRHIPRPSFVKWRDNVMRQFVQQIPQPDKNVIYSSRLKASISYTRGDNRKRDIPAIIDSLWHVLERMKIISNDFNIKELHFYDIGLDRKEPKVEIILTPLP